MIGYDRIKNWQKYALVWVKKNDISELAFVADVKTAEDGEIIEVRVALARELTHLTWVTQEMVDRGIASYITYDNVLMYLYQDMEAADESIYFTPLDAMFTQWQYPLTAGALVSVECFGGKVFPAVLLEDTVTHAGGFGGEVPVSTLQGQVQRVHPARLRCVLPMIDPAGVLPAILNVRYGTNFVVDFDQNSYGVRYLNWLNSTAKRLRDDTLDEDQKSMLKGIIHGFNQSEDMKFVYRREPLPSDSDTEEGGTPKLMRGRLTPESTVSSSMMDEDAVQKLVKKTFKTAEQTLHDEVVSATDKSTSRGEPHTWLHIVSSGDPLGVETYSLVSLVNKGAFDSSLRGLKQFTAHDVAEAIRQYAGPDFKVEPVIMFPEDYKQMSPEDMELVRKLANLARSHRAVTSANTDSSSSGESANSKAPEVTEDVQQGKAVDFGSKPEFIFPED